MQNHFPPKRKILCMYVAQATYWKPGLCPGWVESPQCLGGFCQNSSIWNRIYSCLLLRVGVCGTCAMCELPHRYLKLCEVGPAIQLYILWCPSRLKYGANGHQTGQLSWTACAGLDGKVDRGSGKNISLTSHCKEVRRWDLSTQTL